MSRFEVAEAAVTEKLRALKLKPEMTINLFDLGVPLNAAGFSQEEIIAVLYALEQDKLLEFAPGNRLRLLKRLP
ncbi:hypothetical protein [Rhizobium sp. BK060]|uniref:hypothetical protein n=1 Tax=Rhizobium sp. BK060 TaxID=2587096 RepID=UPI00160B3219|nr:hypothetical protein [Rhizobium sp. BK060]MBB3398783.1 hypothetical protein [Rhizobium sp. BK060]